MDNIIQITDNLFSRKHVSLFKANIKGEDRLMLLLQDPFFKTKEYAVYFKKRKEQLGSINLPQILDMDKGIHSNFPYISFGYVFKTFGKTLDQVIPVLKNKADMKHNLMVALVKIFRDFHQEGVSVGNSSPTLFMISDSGTPYYLDIMMGWDDITLIKKIGRFYDEELSFLSPEHLKGQPITPASDVFSLALFIIFYQTGKTFSPQQIKEAQIDIPSELSDYKGLLEKMMLPESGDRIASDTVYEALLENNLPIRFAYYDKNKIADGECTRCNKPILLSDARVIGSDHFCQKCIGELSGGKAEVKAEKKEAFCKYHPKRPAAHKCVSCSCDICEDCAENIDGKIFCPSCAYDERKRVEKEKARKLFEEHKKEREQMAAISVQEASQEDSVVDEFGPPPETYSDDSYVKEPARSSGTNEFEEMVPTITEDITNPNLLSSEKKKKRKLPLFILIPVILIPVLIFAIVLSSKKSYDTKGIKAIKKEIKKVETLNDKVDLGLRLADLYSGNENDPEHMSKAYAVLEKLIANPSMDAYSLHRIYFKMIDYYRAEKRYSDILKTYNTLEGILKGDKLLYPTTIFSKAQFYAEINEKKRAMKLYRFLMENYKGSRVGNNAYKEYKKLRK